tara:strand:+ start:622 stop:936 length:315 start_codon:yes stop_codon:yes gene_type:complete
VIKKILVTGVNSYVGNSFTEYCHNNFDITKTSLKNNDWINLDFSQFDIVLHVAAIVHSAENTDMTRYREINRDITIKIAEKAKENGVSHFIFIGHIKLAIDHIV